MVVDSNVIKNLLESGVHFGHQTNKWNPKMKRYIFGEKSGIYIIDLENDHGLQRVGELAACPSQRRTGGNRRELALAHNGNLINAPELRPTTRAARHIFNTTSDTEIILHLLADAPESRTPMTPWPNPSATCTGPSAWSSCCRTR